MAKPRWTAFPHASKDYDYPGAALEKAWSRLHRGDREPFPDAAGITALIEANPKLKPKMAVGEAAEILQEAWRAYHRGDFAEAVDLGLSVGLLGHNVANKATNIHATYLEEKEPAKLELFQASAARAEALMAAAKGLANAHYLHAQALGRYSQGISIGKALAQGLAGKVRASLEAALKCAPEHADAHIALGTYHAEIINKVGGMIGGLTYGASKDDGVKHFETALKLNPDSAVARIEYANGLVMMFGNSKMKQAVALYTEAAKSKPADAMERLDVELAKEELAD
jgi:tetratricopeptide (TPR) repeat protein